MVKALIRPPFEEFVGVFIAHDDGTSTLEEATCYFEGLKWSNTLKMGRLHIGERLSGKKS